MIVVLHSSYFSYFKGASADERRRSDSLRSIKTLDGLLEELQLMGFSIKRSALYLRLLPRRCNTREGRRQVTAVPVRLIKRKLI